MNNIPANDLKKPAPVGEYLTKTFNNMGLATSYIDKFTQQFIDLASHDSSPVLEIGACYGAVSVAALEAGATVIANDLDVRHLQILRNETPPECLSRLTLLPGKFPDVLDLADNSIGACYIARTLGYLEFNALQSGLQKLYACLKPQAKLFIISATLYSNIFRELIPVYEQRLLNNDMWPGYFNHLKTMVSEVYKPYVPEKLNFFDDRTLGRELNRAGFIVEQAQYFPRDDCPPFFRFDGREALAMIARKP